MTSIPVVQFTSPSDFNDELRACADSIADKLVRVTMRSCRASSFPVRSVFVTASFIWSGHIVRLDIFCGEVSTVGGGVDDELNAKVENRAADEIRRIETAADALGLFVRAGVITDTAWFDSGSSNEKGVSS